MLCILFAIFILVCCYCVDIVNKFIFTSITIYFELILNSEINNVINNKF